MYFFFVELQQSVQHFFLFQKIIRRYPNAKAHITVSTKPDDKNLTSDFEEAGNHKTVKADY